MVTQIDDLQIIKVNYFKLNLTMDNNNYNYYYYQQEQQRQQRQQGQQLFQYDQQDSKADQQNQENEQLQQCAQLEYQPGCSIQQEPIKCCAPMPGKSFSTRVIDLSWQPAPMAAPSPDKTLSSSVYFGGNPRKLWSSREPSGAANQASNTNVSTDYSNNYAEKSKSDGKSKRSRYYNSDKVRWQRITNATNDLARLIKYTGRVSKAAIIEDACEQIKTLLTRLDSHSIAHSRMAKLLDMENLPIEEVLKVVLEILEDVIVK